jgi:S1-C subfamily serine protease
MKRRLTKFVKFYFSKLPDARNSTVSSFTLVFFSWDSKVRSEKMQSGFPTYGSGNSSSRKYLVLITILVIILLSSFAFVAYYYKQYANTNQEITSLEEQQINSFKQLLTANGTYPSISYFANSNQTINSVKIYSYANQSVVTVEGTQLVSNGVGGSSPTLVLGSGFVVVYSNSYYVVTNDHVVAGDSNLSITFSDGNGYGANIVGSDPYSDLAVLSTNAPSSEFHPLAVTPSSNLTVGQWVLAIGNPFGLSGSMTVGIVSQVGRTIIDPTAGNFPVADVVQISTPINPGNSGGPLLNSFGQVIGITTAVVSGSQGVGFAIPSDTILREIPVLITTSSYNLHPYLGITEEPMSYDVARAMGTSVTYGVLINSTVQNGPSSGKLLGGTRTAQVDGETYVLGGDIIISANGTRIISIDSLASWLEEHALPGDIVQFGIIRSNSNMTVSVTIGTRPSL